MVIDSMIMLDVKKTYAYRQVSAEAKVDDTNTLVSGKIFDKPAIKKKSGFGVKSDMIDMTKDILNFIVESILNTPGSIKEKYEKTLEGIGKFKKEFNECVKSFNIKRIGTPIKWNKKINAISAMQVYNAIVEKSFQYLSTGYLMYINVSSAQLFNNLDIDIAPEKINAIAFPPKFNPKHIVEAFKTYGLTFNLEKQWNNIYNTTCSRTVQGLLKNEASKC